VAVGTAGAEGRARGRREAVVRVTAAMAVAAVAARAVRAAALATVDG